MGGGGGCFFTRPDACPPPHHRSGSPNLTAVPSWLPLLNTPPHPEYPSGHSTTVGSGLYVLQQALHTDNVTFAVGSEGAPSLGLRNYTSLSAAVQEVSDSRRVGGGDGCVGGLGNSHAGEDCAHAGGGGGGHLGVGCGTPSLPPCPHIYGR